MRAPTELTRNAILAAVCWLSEAALVLYWTGKARRHSQAKLLELSASQRGILSNINQLYDT